MESNTRPAATAKAGPMGGLVAVIARHRVLAALVVLAALPFVTPYEALAVNILIFGLYAMGFNLIFGYAGMLSFGHAALFGLGAYGCGVSIAKFAIPWFLALPIGIAVAGIGSVVIGWFAIRSRGIYFAMITLALSQVVYYSAYQWVSLTGGEDGLRGVNVPAIDVFGLHFDMLDPLVKYYVLYALAAVAIALFSRILHSPYGAVLEAIRENETRALACGYDVARTRWLAFILSGVFSGFAGALYAIHLSVVPIETLNYFNSAEVLMITLLGGMGTFFGAFVGAYVYIMLQDVMTVVTVHWQLVVGILFVVLILFFPRGIWGSLLKWVRA
ncbi:branched-chain amino acid ABC transporter permease [Aquabacter spiritensis]|uniref:Amino acid/amide ABC transporter membrane protein 2 (HAAT family) n=1 Tax=Aquabacter spiritensis TaxID=933073 RepID=A0A4R3LYE9_9HYPH|nr:branched-chain amino acid ABC transporter permease [Aquabacter spiritensis]TCT05672.1 amino acid/amide ABC transporter membrane protein 2 (HAAT family) [Aquabacter spiritensis]